MNPLIIGHHTHLMKELTTIEKVKEIKLKNKDENTHQHFHTFICLSLPFTSPVFVHDTEPLHGSCSGGFCLYLLSHNNDKEIK
jgi:hypothetical protein